MPAATTKSDLIAVCEKDFAKLQATLESVPEALAAKPFEGGPSIKETVSHRAEWIAMYLRWWEDGQAGRPVHMPAEGYRWNQLVPLNAKIREAHAGLGWAAARALLEERHAALMAHLNATEEADLYGGPMIGGNGKWTAGRFAEASGASHSRSARTHIRKCLRGFGA